MLSARPHLIIAAWLLSAGVVDCQMYEDYDVQRNAELPPRPFRTKGPKMMLINNRTKTLGKIQEQPKRVRIKPDLWLGNIALAARPTRTPAVPLVTSQQRRSFEALKDLLTATSTVPRTFVASLKTTVGSHADTAANTGDVDPWKSILGGGVFSKSAKTTTVAMSTTMTPPQIFLRSLADNGIRAQSDSASWLPGKVKKDVPELPGDSKSWLRDNEAASKDDKEGSKDNKESPKEDKEVTTVSTKLAATATVKTKKAFPLVWAYAIAGTGAIAMILLLSAILGMVTTVYGTHRKCRKSVSCPCAIGKTFKSLRFTCGNVQTVKATPVARADSITKVNARKKLKHDKGGTNLIAPKGSARPRPTAPEYALSTRGYGESDDDRRTHHMVARNDLAYEQERTAASEYPHFGKGYSEFDGDGRIHKMATRNDLGYQYERTAASGYPRYPKGYCESDDDYRAHRMAARNDLAYEHQRSGVLTNGYDSDREGNNDTRFAQVDCICECECHEETGASAQTRLANRMYRSPERTPASRRSRSTKSKRKSDRNSSSESAGKKDTSKRAHSAKDKKKSGRNFSGDSSGKREASKRSHSTKGKKSGRNSSSDSADKKNASKRSRSAKGDEESHRDSSVVVQDDLDTENPEPTAASKKSRSKRKGKVDMVCECPEPNETRSHKRKGTSTRVMCCTDTIVIPNDAMVKCANGIATFETFAPSKNGDNLLLGDEDSSPDLGDCLPIF